MWLEKMKKSLVLAVIMLFFAPATQGAQKSAAVLDDGYAGKVMQKVLETGKIDIRKRTDVRLNLDEDGRITDCRLLRGEDAGNLCSTIRSGAPYGQPPYGVPTAILLSFWSGESNAPVTVEIKAAEKPVSNTPGNAKYIAKITREIRNSIYIPQETKKGTYSVAAKFQLDKSGVISDAAIVKGSNDARLDKYVLQGIARAHKVTPPPADLKNPVQVVFSLTRN